MLPGTREQVRIIVQMLPGHKRYVRHHIVPYARGVAAACVLSRSFAARSRRDPDIQPSILSLSAWSGPCAGYAVRCVSPAVCLVMCVRVYIGQEGLVMVLR